MAGTPLAQLFVDVGMTVDTKDAQSKLGTLERLLRDISKSKKINISDDDLKSLKKQLDEFKAAAELKIEPHVGAKSLNERAKLLQILKATKDKMDELLSTYQAILDIEKQQGQQAQTTGKQTNLTLDQQIAREQRLLEAKEKHLALEGQLRRAYKGRARLAKALEKTSVPGESHSQREIRIQQRLDRFDARHITPYQTTPQPRFQQRRGKKKVSKKKRQSRKTPRTQESTYGQSTDEIRKSRESGTRFSRTSISDLPSHHLKKSSAKPQPGSQTPTSPNFVKGMRDYVREYNRRQEDVEWGELTLKQMQAMGAPADEIQAAQEAIQTRRNRDIGTVADYATGRRVARKPKKTKVQPQPPVDIAPTPNEASEDAKAARAAYIRKVIDPQVAKRERKIKKLTDSLEKLPRKQRTRGSYMNIPQQQQQRDQRAAEHIDKLKGFIAAADARYEDETASEKDRKFAATQAAKARQKLEDLEKQQTTGQQPQQPTGRKTAVQINKEIKALEEEIVQLRQDIPPVSDFEHGGKLAPSTLNKAKVQEPSARAKARKEAEEVLGEYKPPAGATAQEIQEGREAYQKALVDLTNHILKDSAQIAQQEADKAAGKQTEPRSANSPEEQLRKSKAAHAPGKFAEQVREAKESVEKISEMSPDELDDFASHMESITGKKSGVHDPEWGVTSDDAAQAYEEQQAREAREADAKERVRQFQEDFQSFAERNIQNMHRNTNFLTGKSLEKPRPINAAPAELFTDIDKKLQASQTLRTTWAEIVRLLQLFGRANNNAYTKGYAQLKKYTEAAIALQVAAENVLPVTDEQFAKWTKSFTDTPKAFAEIAEQEKLITPGEKLTTDITQGLSKTALQDAVKKNADLVASRMTEAKQLYGSFDAQPSDFIVKDLPAAEQREDIFHKGKLLEKGEEAGLQILEALKTAQELETLPAYETKKVLIAFNDAIMNLMHRIKSLEPIEDYVKQYGQDFQRAAGLKPFIERRHASQLQRDTNEAIDKFHKVGTPYDWRDDELRRAQEAATAGPVYDRPIAQEQARFQRVWEQSGYPPELAQEAVTFLDSGTQHVAALRKVQQLQFGQSSPLYTNLHRIGATQRAVVSKWAQIGQEGPAEGEESTAFRERVNRGLRETILHAKEARKAFTKLNESLSAFQQSDGARDERAVTEKLAKHYADAGRAVEFMNDELQNQLRITKRIEEAHSRKARERAAIERAAKEATQGSKHVQNLEEVRAIHKARTGVTAHQTYESIEREVRSPRVEGLASLTDKVTGRVVELEKTVDQTTATQVRGWQKVEHRLQEAFIDIVRYNREARKLGIEEKSRLGAFKSYENLATKIYKAKSPVEAEALFETYGTSVKARRQVLAAQRGRVVKGDKRLTEAQAARLKKIDQVVRNLESSAVLALGPLSAVGARIRSLGAIAHRSALGVTALIGATVGLGFGLVKLLQNMIRVQKEVELITGSFRVATSSAVLANREFHRLANTSLELGTDFKSSATEYSKLLAAVAGTGVTFKEARLLYEGVSRAASALKLPVQTTAGAFRALAQMASKGTVQAEEIRGQFGERIPGAMALAARAMGITAAEFNDKLRRGEILAKDLFKNFGKELIKAYEEGSIAAANTLLAQEQRLSTQWTLLLKQLNEQIDAAGTYADVLYAAGSATEWVRKNTIPTVSILAAFVGALLWFAGPSVGGLVTGTFGIIGEKISAYRERTQKAAKATTSLGNAARAAGRFLARLAFPGFVVGTALFFIIDALKQAKDRTKELHNEFKDWLSTAKADPVLNIEKGYLFKEEFDLQAKKHTQRLQELNAELALTNKQLEGLEGPQPLKFADQFWRAGPFQSEGFLSSAIIAPRSFEELQDEKKRLQKELEEESAKAFINRRRLEEADEFLEYAERHQLWSKAMSKEADRMDKMREQAKAIAFAAKKTREWLQHSADDYLATADIVHKTSTGFWVPDKADFSGVSLDELTRAWEFYDKLAKKEGGIKNYLEEIQKHYPDIFAKFNPSVGQQGLVLKVILEIQSEHDQLIESYNTQLKFRKALKDTKKELESFGVTENAVINAGVDDWKSFQKIYQDALKMQPQELLHSARQNKLIHPDMTISVEEYALAMYNATRNMQKLIKDKTRVLDYVEELNKVSEDNYWLQAAGDMLYFDDALLKANVDAKELATGLQILNTMARTMPNFLEFLYNKHGGTNPAELLKNIVAAKNFVDPRQILHERRERITGYSREATLSENVISRGLTSDQAERVRAIEQKRRELLEEWGPLNLSPGSPTFQNRQNYVDEEMAKWITQQQKQRAEQFFTEQRTAIRNTIALRGDRLNQISRSNIPDWLTQVDTQVANIKANFDDLETGKLFEKHGVKTFAELEEVLKSSAADQQLVSMSKHVDEIAYRAKDTELSIKNWHLRDSAVDRMRQVADYAKKLRAAIANTDTEALNSHAEALRRAGETVYDNATPQELIDTYARMLEKLGLREKELERWTKLEQGIDNSFQNAGDKIADAFGTAFATGERAILNWRDLFTEVIADIQSQLIRLFVTDPLTQLGSAFINAAITKLPGIGTPASGPAPQHGGSPYALPGAVAAKGLVLDGGRITAFAKGGIINAPTMFSGRSSILAGEAGPEAIVPLRRGPGGSLGIESSGMKPQVNVNIVNNAGVETNVQRRSSGDQEEIIVTLERALAGRVSQGGPLSKAIQTSVASKSNTISRG